MGDGIKSVNPVTDAAKKKLARSLTSRFEIPKGATLTEDMLILKSPGDGLKWKERELVIGKRSVNRIDADVTLSIDDFE
jgi:sialic acid synthase